MVSRKLRNKTRRLRGGGCSSSKPSTIVPTTINTRLEAAKKLMNNARTARERNKAEKKAERERIMAARKAESKVLRDEAEKHAKEYANSKVKNMGNIANTSNLRNSIYSLYMSAFDTKIINNILKGVPVAEGIDNFFNTYGKEPEITDENMAREMNELMRQYPA